MGYTVFLTDYNITNYNEKYKFNSRIKDNGKIHLILIYNERQ